MSPSPTVSLPRVLVSTVVGVVVLVTTLCSVLASQAGAGPVAQATQRVQAHRPNIVMVMADDMRVDDLRFAPQVRRLVARHGLTFENSFAPYPLCCPSRASFLTGQYAHNHGVYWHEPPYGYGAFDDSRTLATSLSQAGYRTGFVGKYLNRYGVARSLVSGEPSWHYVPEGWTDWIGAVENPHVRGIHGDTYNYFDTPYNVNGRIDNRYRGRYQAGVVGDFSVSLARKYAATQRPFFMYVNYLAPHFGGPFERDDPTNVRNPNGKIYDQFKTPARPGWVKGRFNSVIRRGAGMPRNGGPSEADISDKPTFFSSLPEPGPAERSALRNLTRQRAEAIYVMDRQIARLIRQLKASGEWSDTVFMFTSDNGYFLGEHRNRTGKVRAHEPSLRVPFLLTGPGMRTAASRYDPISTVDVSATILDLAGAQSPRPADGTSRVPTMRRGDQGWTVPVLTEAAFPIHHRSASMGVRSSIGVRTPRYSYIKNWTGRSELYDLVEDPLELQNVISDDAHARDLHLLVGVWRQLKDCRAAQCRVPLPLALQTQPLVTRAMTRSYWARIERVYGW